MNNSLSTSVKLEILDCMNNLLGNYPYSNLDSTIPSLIFKNDKNISLYLGDASDASNIKVLKELNIKNILNCAGIHFQYAYPSSFNVYSFNAHDSFNYSLLDNHLTESMKYLKSVMNDTSNNNSGNVLVHCMSGMNRSATIVMAYLMLYENMNLLDGIKFLCNRRQWLLTNKGFKLQLIDLAYKNNKLGDWKRYKKIKSSKL